ncbi:reverse transcriptase [Gossypium australe]|uniref:Reverse transcriptase n=1 Tax=Gossypium australe TaxID=47621 RepID=A0A5B6VFC7_9ROSI|nr:reverse transcriptase [Gossypium australe]
MEDVARSYFYNLFTAKDKGNYVFVLSGIDNCVFEGDNLKLTVAYTSEEIREVVFEMGVTKAPGEDGFPTLFYKKCWHIIGDEIRNGDMKVSSFNFTNIMLIPKNSNPLNMMHFRPISLCNILYKILAKAITNRFRGVIGKYIDEAQSAFVLGRLISDNVLLAYEILNTLKKKRRERNDLW